MNPQSLAPYRSILADSEVFAGLSTAELDLALDAAKLVEATADQIIVAEGQKGEGLYVILEGEVEFFLGEQAGGGLRRPTRVRLNTLGPVRCFGEYSLIDDEPNSASAKTTMPTLLCFFAQDVFRRLMDQHDGIAKRVYGNLLRLLVGRLRHKDRELDVLLLVDERDSQ